MSLGQVAYEAYKSYSKGKSLISGANLPDWEDQAVEIKEAWEEASDAVINRYNEEV